MKLFRISLPLIITTSVVGAFTSSYWLNRQHGKSEYGFVNKKKNIHQIRSTIELSAFWRRQNKKSNANSIPIETCQELDDYFLDTQQKFRLSNGEIDYNELLKCLCVKGDTQTVTSSHPAVQLLHQRRRSPSSKGDDECKVALVIEGGGMRGCVTAGMVCAIYYLGLQDTIDVIYGSSAGTVIGSYFNTRQLPWFGPEVYYDSLTTAGRKFINTRRFLRAIGWGLLNPFLWKDVILRRNHGKPVLNLPYLLQTTLQETKPLNWTKFVQMQERQPVKVVASGLLKAQSSVVLSLDQSSFSSLKELSSCMHAACLLPGVAGPIMNINMDALHNTDTTNCTDDRDTYYVLRNNMDPKLGMEALADTLIYEPLPYRSAIKVDNVTHVIMLRSRPDGTDVTGKSNFIERRIVKRFFKRKNPQLSHIYEYMKRHFHKKIYAEQILELNHAAKDIHRSYNDTSRTHIATIAVPQGSPEVSRLETRREQIFDGVRRGFARAYDALVEDPNERGNGRFIAEQFFPPNILNYDPLNMTNTHVMESAFDQYLKQQQLTKNDSDNEASKLWGKTADETIQYNLNRNES